MTGRLCSVGECGRPHLAKGLCSGHYRRKRLTGSVGTAPLRAFYRPAIERVQERVERQGACLVFMGARTPQGYGSIRDERGPTRGAHVVVAEHEHGPRPSPDHDVLHSCDNPPCVEPTHLRWGNAQENHLDSVQRGRHVPPPRGRPFTKTVPTATGGTQ